MSTETKITSSLLSYAVYHSLHPPETRGASTTPWPAHQHARPKDNTQGAVLPRCNRGYIAGWMRSISAALLSSVLRCPPCFAVPQETLVHRARARSLARVRTRNPRHRTNGCVGARWYGTYMICGSLYHPSVASTPSWLSGTPRPATAYASGRGSRSLHSNWYSKPFPYQIKQV